MFGHLSSVRVVAVNGWKYLLIGEILIVLYNLLMVLVGLGALHGPAPVPDRPLLVWALWRHTRHTRPTRHACHDTAQHCRWYRRGRTVTGLAVSRLCTYLEITTHESR